MAKDNPGIGCANYSCCGSIVPCLLFISFCSHVVGHARPGKEHHDDKQNRDAGGNTESRRDNGENDNHHIKKWDVRPDLYYTLEYQVKCAAIKTHGTACGDANYINCCHESDGKQQRDARAINQPGKNVTTRRVSTQIVLLFNRLLKK